RDVEPDQKLALQLFWRLSQGHQPFIDQHMLVGEPWARRIKEEIEASDYMVLLLSDRSVESPMVVEELKIAETVRLRQGRPRLLPVRLKFEHELPYDLGAILNPLQYVAWSSDKDSDRLIDDVVAAVQGSKDRLLAPARSPQQPLPPDLPLSA